MAPVENNQAGHENEHGLRSIAPAPIGTSDGATSQVSSTRRSWANGCRVIAPTANSHGAVTYLCVTSISFPEACEVSVRRRYSEFRSLRDAMLKERPELSKVLPRLPAKTTMITFESRDLAFVENRRLALELFLKTVVLDGELSASKVLISWLGV
ncbi:PX domain-containing protein ypt35 [Savitreella phatthalungensis]